MLKLSAAAALIAVSAVAAAQTTTPAQPPAAQPTGPAQPPAATQPAAPAQPPASSDAPAANTQMPPPEFIQAAQGFGQCLMARIEATEASVTPEAGAAAAMTACASQRTQMEQIFETWITALAVPEPQKAAAREQLRTQLAAAPGRLAEAIRRRRAGPSPAQ